MLVLLLLRGDIIGVQFKECLFSERGPWTQNILSFATDVTIAQMIFSDSLALASDFFHPKLALCTEQSDEGALCTKNFLASQEMWETEAYYKQRSTNYQDHCSSSTYYPIS